MTLKKKIILTVTNDLSYDQRMIRICTTLSENGYDVLLVGRKRSTSIPLDEKKFKQKRLSCFFDNGIQFYVLYNIRLFFFLLFNKFDAVCAIDLDTIIPVFFASILHGKKRVYDAHEYFTEMKEVKNNLFRRVFWGITEQVFLPKFKAGYTVCQSISDEFNKKYAVEYRVIRNLPYSINFDCSNRNKENYIVYAGAVNEGRGFDILLSAMKEINYTLKICGDGNYMNKLKELIKKYEISDKIILTGMLTPDKLREEIQKAQIGIATYESQDLNQYWALPNKFFDYIQSCVPQISMNYPEFRRINDEFGIGVLLNSLEKTEIVNAINLLLRDVVLYQSLEHNCSIAREVLNWKMEEIKLMNFYKSLFDN